jgi:hypothetical protein
VHGPGHVDGRPSFMNTEVSPGDALALSVVIPSFNSARWLPSTLDALSAAVRAADRPAEVIVVDDGSTDETQAVVESLAKGFPGPVQVLRQANLGRFLARWNGIAAARAPFVLLLDSRVLLRPDSLRFMFGQLERNPSKLAWNAHVATDPKAPLVGLFWDVPTHVFWGRYLRTPRTMDLTADNFDRAPKGTGVFLAERHLLVEAFEHSWPDTDSKLVSDDTKLLRWIAETSGIRLEPGFSAVYRPRTTVPGFVRHTLDRGTLFVDSYAGTSPLRSAVIVALACAPIALAAGAVALAVTGHVRAAAVLVGAAILAALAPVLPAAANRCPPRSIAAYIVCLPLFVGPFWLGLVRGVLVHRRAFRRSRTAEAVVASERGSR